MISVQKRSVPATYHRLFAQSRRRSCALGGTSATTAELVKAGREIAQWPRPGRHRAAVDGADRLAQSGAGKILKHASNQVLHRVLPPPGVSMLDAERAGDAQKARMLAGT